MFTKVGRSFWRIESAVGGQIKRAYLGIVGSDEVLDLSYQFSDAPEGAGANGLLGDDVEPDFNLIQPGRCASPLRSGAARFPPCATAGAV